MTKKKIKNKSRISKFKFLAHTADIKFQAFGKKIEEVFENSSLALFKTIYDKKIKETKKFKIKASGNDLEGLLENFLEQFLILFDSENFLPSQIRNLKLDKKKFEITCEVLGDSAEKYKLSTHIKAITYNEMFVKFDSKKKIWISQVVLDV